MAIQETIEDLKSYAKLERVLALFCVASPLVMIVADGGVRDSISAYYDMTENQLFYFPLTAASLLFLVNGFVKKRNWYNAWLGIMLAGVVLLNYQSFTWYHGAFALAFFVGNAAVMVFYSREVSRRFRVAVLIGVVLAFLAWRPFGWYSLFWAEWISLGLIASHFLLDASTHVQYRAAERGEGPALAS